MRGNRAQKGGGYVGVMRGIRRIPLMPSIPLCIGVAEDSYPPNEGDSRKTLFFSSKVPHFCRQSATLFAAKYHFAIDEVPFRAPRKPSSPVAKAVLVGHESRPRRVHLLSFQQYFQILQNLLNVGDLSVVNMRTCLF